MVPTAIDCAIGSGELASALRATLDSFACSAGTIHVLRDGALSLAEVTGMPAEFVDRIQTIPIGKGMAGLAAERGEPVTVCNLQQDGSGKARPDARESGMLGSIAVPITNDGGSQEFWDFERPRPTTGAILRWVR